MNMTHPIFSRSPSIPCGCSTALLLIAIECLLTAEATSLQHVLHPVVQSLPAEPSTQDILNAFGCTPAVKTFFSGTTSNFYPVAIDSPAGIYWLR